MVFTFPLWGRGRARIGISLVQELRAGDDGLHQRPKPIAVGGQFGLHALDGGFV